MAAIGSATTRSCSPSSLTARARTGSTSPSSAIRLAPEVRLDRHRGGDAPGADVSMPSTPMNSASIASGCSSAAGRPADISPRWSHSTRPFAAVFRSAASSISSRSRSTISTRSSSSTRPRSRRSARCHVLPARMPPLRMFVGGAELPELKRQSTDLRRCGARARAAGRAHDSARASSFLDPRRAAPARRRDRARAGGDERGSHWQAAGVACSPPRIDHSGRSHPRR